ncbi:MAG: hypothetical protein FWG91_05740 [Lachnospiraceae bacterium]|nr:hypothetical protein [Lachnospiraceae bacterium]
MASYNLKIYNYVDGKQIRIYNNAVKKDYENEEKRSKEELAEYKKAMCEEEINDKKCRSVHVSKSRAVNKIYEIARANTWEWFVTLTFNPDKVDSFNYDDVTRNLRRWLDNVKRNYAPNLKYIIVPELHKSGRYHFHGMLSETGSINFADSGTRDKHGDIIYNVGDYHLGFTTATKVKDNAKVSSYISKYITKDICIVTANKKRYWASRNLDKAEIIEMNAEHGEIMAYLDSIKNDIVHTKEKACKESGTLIRYIEVAGRNDSLI